MEYSWSWRDTDKQAAGGYSLALGQELSTSHNVSGLTGQVVLEGPRSRVLEAFKHRLTRCPSQEYAISLRGLGPECGPGAGPRQGAHPSAQSAELYQLPALQTAEQEVSKLLVLETPLYLCQPVNQGHSRA